MKNEILMVGGILKSKLVKKPYKLNFAVTSLCNSKCTTCNIWKTYKDNPKKLKEELNLKEIQEIFSKLPKTIIWLSLTGGEPFLKENFEEIIISAMKTMNNLRMISIPSNGLATERILKMVNKIMKTKKEIRIIVTLSIEGPEKIHNKIRGVGDGFKKSWETYEKLKELSKKYKNFNVSIETTISKYNIDYLPQFIEKLIKGGNELTLTIAHNAALYKNEKNSKLMPSQINKIKKIVQIAINGKKYLNPKNRIESIFLKNLPEYAINPKKSVMPCYALKSSISLDQNGNVLPCLMWGMNLGNVRDYGYDIKRIISSKKAFCVMNTIKNKRCPNCWTPCEGYQSVIGNLINMKISPF
ncbi:MAG: radical SAM protein [archaeon]